jgi:hypothetical protein
LYTKCRIKEGREIRAVSQSRHVGRAEAQFTTKTRSFSRVAKMTAGNGHGTTPALQAIVKRPDGAGVNTTQVWFEPEDTRTFTG